MATQTYNGNANLKRKGIEIQWTPDMLQEYVKCAQDTLHFVEEYIKIVHVDHGLIPLKVYDYQKEIIEKMGSNRQVAVCTSRQAGKTTTAVAVILHYVLFNDHKTVALLANKGDAARESITQLQLQTLLLGQISLLHLLMRLSTQQHFMSTTNTTTYIVGLRRQAQ